MTNARSIIVFVAVWPHKQESSSLIIISLTENKKALLRTLLDWLEINMCFHQVEKILLTARILRVLRCSDTPGRILSTDSNPNKKAVRSGLLSALHLNLSVPLPPHESIDRPLSTMTFRGCLERGKDENDCGTEKHSELKHLSSCHPATKKNIPFDLSYH